MAPRSLWWRVRCSAHRSANFSGIWTRDQLKAYDPDLAKLLADVYGDGKWRYVRADNRPLIADGVTMTRAPEELAHLAGLDREKMPVFDFRNFPRIRALATTQPGGTQPSRREGR